MPGKADLRSGDRALGEDQRLLETSGPQQSVDLTCGGSSGGGHCSRTDACPSSRHADATQGCEQRLELRVADIQMEHKTDGLAVHAQRAHLLVLQLLQKELGTELLVKLENHDIRFDGQNA